MQKGDGPNFSFKEMTLNAAQGMDGREKCGHQWLTELSRWETGTAVGAEKKVDKTKGSSGGRRDRTVEGWEMGRRREAEVRNDSKASGGTGELGEHWEGAG